MCHIVRSEMGGGLGYGEPHHPSASFFFLLGAGPGSFLVFVPRELLRASMDSVRKMYVGCFVRITQAPLV